MESKIKGQQHGAAVRRAAEFFAGVFVALAKDAALNVRRGGGYVAGFTQGLRQPGTTGPNV